MLGLLGDLRLLRPPRLTPRFARYRQSTPGRSDLNVPTLRISGPFGFGSCPDPCEGIGPEDG